MKKEGKGLKRGKMGRKDIYTKGKESTLERESFIKRSYLEEKREREMIKTKIGN
jgi:hypothetical protein